MAPKQGGPRIATYRVPGPSQKVKMHVDSTQVGSCLNPVRSVRDAQRRAGIKPTDHARHNLMAVKEQSRLNALRRMSSQDEDGHRADIAPRKSPPAADHPGKAQPPWGHGQDSSAGGVQRQRSGGGGGGSGGGASCGGDDSTRRNFVEENKAVAAAARQAPRAESRPGDGQSYMTKREYGQVPAYLVERKFQMAKEMRAREEAREAARVPAGMRLMPESERQETLALLERNRGEVEAALAAMPIIVETHTLRRRKDDLERRLAEIEEATRVFSRREVLVRL